MINDDNVKICVLDLRSFLNKKWIKETWVILNLLKQRNYVILFQILFYLSHAFRFLYVDFNFVRNISSSCTFDALIYFLELDLFFKCLCNKQFRIAIVLSLPTPL